MAVALEIAGLAIHAPANAGHFTATCESFLQGVVINVIRGFDEAGAAVWLADGVLSYVRLGRGT